MGFAHCLCFRLADKFIVLDISMTDTNIREDAVVTNTVKAFEESRMTQDEIIIKMAKAIFEASQQDDNGKREGNLTWCDLVRYVEEGDTSEYYYLFSSSLKKAQAALSVLLPHIREMVVALRCVDNHVNGSGLYYAEKVEQALASIPKEWRGE